MEALPPIRPSRPFPIRLAAIVIDALQEQLPKNEPSVNAWLGSVIRDLVDVRKLTREQRLEWMLSAETQTRLGRR